MAVWSVGWRGTLRRADTVSAGIRTNTDEYGLLRTMVTWCSVCHVLLYFCSARLTESQSPTPYSSVPVRITLPALHSSVRSGGGPPPCALHNVLRQPEGMCYALGESHAHGARGKPYFSPVTPFRPACCTEACGTQCGFFTVRSARPTACGDGAA